MSKSKPLSHYTKYILPTAAFEIERMKNKHWVDSSLSFEDLMYTASNKCGKILSNSTKVTGESRTVVVYMAPSNSIKGLNTCDKAGLCRLSCIRYTGHNGIEASSHMKYNMHITERRTIAFVQYSERFLCEMFKQLDKAVNKKDDPVAYFRGNGSTDIRWELIIDMVALNRDYGLKFYDYTKHDYDFRNLSGLEGIYRLCYSLDENKTFHKSKQIAKYKQAGCSIALAVSLDLHREMFDPEHNQRWLSIQQFCFDDDRPVVNGDLSDNRFLDHGSVVVLKYKYPTGQYAQPVNTRFLYSLDDLIGTGPSDYTSAFINYHFSKLDFLMKLDELEDMGFPYLEEGIKEGYLTLNDCLQHLDDCRKQNTEDEMPSSVYTTAVDLVNGLFLEVTC
jgi:hypothetical protein